MDRDISRWELGRSRTPASLKVSLDRRHIGGINLPTPIVAASAPFPIRTERDMPELCGAITLSIVNRSIDDNSSSNTVATRDTDKILQMTVPVITKPDLGKSRKLGVVFKVHGNVQMFPQPFARWNIDPTEIFGRNNPASGLFNVSGQADADPGCSSSAAMARAASEVPDFPGEHGKKSGGIGKGFQTFSALDLSIHIGQGQHGFLPTDLYAHAVELLRVKIKIRRFAADSGRSVLPFVDPTFFQ